MAQSQTIMSEAFAKSGYVPPESNADKLRRMMAHAITADGPGRGLPEASIARFIALLLAEDDVGLALELVADVLDGVLNKLFREVLAGVKAGEDFGEGDQLRSETHRVGESLSEGGAAAETRSSMKPTLALSRAAVPATTPHPQHAPPGHGINGMQSVIHLSRESWLKRYTVGNQPVGNMNRAQLDAAIKGSRRNCRFLELVRDSWPAHADNQTVGFWLTDEDGDKLYEMAQEEPANA